jgi:hypothetical protein
MGFGFLPSTNIDKILTITNNGDPGHDLVFPPNAVVSSPSSTLFSIIADNCSSPTVTTTYPPGGTCTMTIRFASPGTSGNYTDSFQMMSNDSGNPGSITTINLVGGSAPPDTPVLVSPGNGLSGVGSQQEFRWMTSTDPEGHAIKYQVLVCTDPNFAKNCTPANVVASRNSKGMFYAGGAGLLMIGMTFFGGLKGRKRIVLLFIIAVLFAGGSLVSCRSKDVGGTTPAPAGQVNYFATGLSAGTTYYWKVVADNGQPSNNSASSCSWSFTTQ